MSTTVNDAARDGGNSASSGSEGNGRGSGRNDGAYGDRVGALLLVFAGLCFYVLRATDWFAAVPGDVGDARFNSVILEHLFQWVTGDVRSLSTPPFFYPAPGTLAFSDNHFGSGAVYVLLRALGLAREQAFNGWMVTGFALNMLAMVVVMRRLDFSMFASTAAAFVFTFSLPALAQEGHAQLTYRFAIPLAYLALVRFVSERRLARLAQLAGWGALQFFCSIYLGVFMAYLLLACVLAMAIPALRPERVRWAGPTTRAGTVGALLAIGACAAATGWLLFQYLAVSRGYGFSRAPDDVIAMLPRLHSYLLADRVPGYALLNSWANDVPMRHEHQMFIGFAPLLLALCAWAWAWAPTSGSALDRAAAPRRRLLLHSSATLLILVGLTLLVRDASVYRWLMALPGVSSIRAVTRVVLVMMLPVAILAAIGVENLQRRRATRWLATAGVVLALSAETLAYQPARASIAAWRQQLVPLEKAAQAQTFKDDAVLYVTGRTGDSFALTELDAMVFAQDRKMPTLNGYSGNAPPGYVWPDPCNSPAVRIYSQGSSSYRTAHPTRADVLARTVWLPMEACPFAHMPTGVAAQPPDAAQARRIVLAPTVTGGGPTELNVTLRVRNEGSSTLHTLSAAGHPLRLVWRFVPDPAPTDAQALPAWAAQPDVALSIPPQQHEDVALKLPKPALPGIYDLQFSMAAEGAVWLHDIGMPIAHARVVVPSP